MCEKVVIEKYESNPNSADRLYKEWSLKGYKNEIFFDYAQSAATYRILYIYYCVKDSCN